MATAFLLIEDGPLARTRIDLTSGSTSIGRKDVDFVLDDIHVGRRHAEIIGEDDAYYVVDLDSRNGTFVNGRELRPRERARLRDGDRLNIARVCNLVFHCSGSDSSSPVPVLVDDASESDSSSTVRSKLDVVPASASISATVSADVKLRSPVRHHARTRCAR